MNAPESVGSNEELGRGIFSSRNARRAARRVPHHVFLERPGETDISVDRLSVAPPDEAVEIADSVGKARNRTFYGWAVVVAEGAAGNGREVVASPILNQNPYHADIVLPRIASEDREEQKRHAQELADVSRWRNRTRTQIKQE